jgi:hypothetical protein
MISDASPVVAAGSSSMITTGSLVETLALFAILSAKVSFLWKQAGERQVRIQKQSSTRIKRCGRGSLLFFVLLIAESGEVKIRPRARRGRRGSRFSWPLGRGGSSSLR